MTNRRRIDIGRFVASVIALVTVVVVAPVVLGRVASVRFGSANPLHGVRAAWDWSAAEAADALGDPLSDDTVIDALIRICLCVAWVAIAVVVVTTVVEVVHMVRHRGLAMPTMRGVGWAQGIARYIAVGLLVVVPLASAKPSLAATRSPSIGLGPDVAAARRGTTRRPNRRSSHHSHPPRRRTPCNAATRSSRSRPNWWVTTSAARWTSRMTSSTPTSAR